jgi:hypothetical protein
MHFKTSNPAFRTVRSAYTVIQGFNVVRFLGNTLDSYPHRLPDPTQRLLTIKKNELKLSASFTNYFAVGFESMESCRLIWAVSDHLS